MRLGLLALVLLAVACDKSGGGSAALLDGATAGADASAATAEASVDAAPAVATADAAAAAAADAAATDAAATAPDASAPDAAAVATDAAGAESVDAAAEGADAATAEAMVTDGGTAAAPAESTDAGTATAAVTPSEDPAAPDAGGATAAATPTTPTKPVAPASNEIVIDEPWGVGDVDVWPLLDALEKVKPQLEGCRPKSGEATRVKVQFHVGRKKIGLAAPAADNTGDVSVARCIANRVKSAAPKWDEGVSGILFVEATLPPK